jgi:hypothetical protein
MDKYHGRSLEDLRSSYRAIGKKLDNIRMDAAILTNILPLPEGKRFWVADEIQWDDPRLDDIRDKFFSLLEKHHDLERTIGRLEAIRDNDLPRWEARQTAYGWLNILGDDGNDWLIQHNLTTVTLTEAILLNPQFLEEMI